MKRHQKYAKWITMVLMSTLILTACSVRFDPLVGSKNPDMVEAVKGERAYEAYLKVMERAINEMYVEDVDTSLLKRSLYPGLFSELDPYTVFYHQGEEPNHLPHAGIFQELRPVHSELVGEKVKLISIPQFNEKTAEEVENLLKNLAEGHHVIIDLRGSEGGLIEEALKIADLFVEKGELLTAYQRHDTEDELFYAQREALFPEMKLVLLVDEDTQGAAELLASILQEHQHAPLIGLNTSGVVIQQRIHILDDVGSFTYVHGSYTTPSKINLYQKGLKPDLVMNFQMPARGFAPLGKEEREDPLDIYSAQQRLLYLGYDVELTGIWSETTQNALESFQKDYGLETTELLDTLTRVKLKQLTYSADDLYLFYAMQYLKKGDNHVGS